MIGQGLLVVGAVVAAGLFSGVETAFLACPRLKVRHLARSGVQAARTIEAALHTPGPYLTSLLVGTNLAVIGGTVAATRLLDRLAPGRGEFLASALMTPIFLVASEIIPKSYFLAHARSLCLMLGGFLEVMRRALAPLVFVVGAPARLLWGSMHSPTLPLTREELLLLARPGVSLARVSKAIGTLLERGIATRRSVATDVMIPREKVVSLDADAPVSLAFPIIRSTGFTHYPVRRGEEWVGCVHVFDLVDANPFVPLGDVAGTLPPIDHEAPLEQILELMREAALHALVVVRNGEQIGFVTLSALMRHLTEGLSEGRG